MKLSMGNWSLVSVLAFGVAAGMLAAPAGASPIFDGNYDGNAVYTYRDDDTGEADFGGDSWDIAGVGFAWDADWMYICLDTVAKFDSDGGAGAFPQQTVFLFQSSDATDSFFFILTMDGTDDLNLVGIGPVADADWDLEIDNDMELRIDLGLLADLDTTDFNFIGRLDNSAAAPDDIIQVVGIPEPAALSIVAIGSLLLVMRRKRRK